MPPGALCVRRAYECILLQLPLIKLCPFTNKLHHYYCTAVAVRCSLCHQGYGGRVLTQKCHLDTAPEGSVITLSFTKSLIQHSDGDLIQHEWRMQFHGADKWRLKYSLLHSLTRKYELEKTLVVHYLHCLIDSIHSALGGDITLILLWCIQVHTLELHWGQIKYSRTCAIFLQITICWCVLDAWLGTRLS